MRISVSASAFVLSMLAIWSLASPSQAQCDQPFLRGDSNTDGTLDLSDGIRTLIALFSGGAAIPCNDAADTNDSGDLDLSDPISTFQFLFSGGKSPPLPGPAVCGADPTVDELDCAGFAPCPLLCDCEDGSRRACGTSDVGDCRLGFQVCLNKAWGPCESAVEPSAELCDDLDNDCDGVPDNGFELIGQPCDGPDGDVCELGTWVCAGDLTALECNEQAASGNVELCDGLDNDCDTVIDNGFDNDEDGWTTCENDCDDANFLVNPGRDVDPVDGLDNDCDREIDEGPFTINYARDIQPIWNASCNSSLCHDATNPAGSLNLAAAASYSSLVGKPSKEARTLLLVRPGDEEGSYLWHKLNDTQRSVGGSGNSMPRGSPLLPKTTREVILLWILEGAREGS